MMMGKVVEKLVEEKMKKIDVDKLSSRELSDALDRIAVDIVLELVEVPNPNKKFTIVDVGDRVSEVLFELKRTLRKKYNIRGVLYFNPYTLTELVFAKKGKADFYLLGTMDIDGAQHVTFITSKRLEYKVYKAIGVVTGGGYSRRLIIKENDKKKTFYVYNSSSFERINRFVLNIVALSTMLRILKEVPGTVLIDKSVFSTYNFIKKVSWKEVKERDYEYRILEELLRVLEETNKKVRKYLSRR